MRIRFISPDPRAGMIATMDSRRGQDLIDSGAAERVSDNSDHAAEPPAPALEPIVQPPDGLPGRRSRRPVKAAPE